MVEREIINDIKSYKVNFIGPLSAREFFLGAAGFALGISVFLFAKEIFTDDFSILLGGIAMLPFITFGFARPYGLPLEKFIVQYIQLQLIAPTTRVYRTQFALEHDKRFQGEKKPKGNKKAAKKEAKNAGGVL